jgi:mersacidin/lichenicidin family type 2 lantibiotic
MSKLDVVRAWKDEEYFSGLSESERSQLPVDPAGLTELTDKDLSVVEGATVTTLFTFTIWFCPLEQTKPQG